MEELEMIKEIDFLDSIETFYKNKRIFITGHTGFKGSWLCRILVGMGAHVTGFALNPLKPLNLFDLCGVKPYMNSIIGDVRDLSSMKSAFAKAQPEIVLHLAAQPLVRESYQEPVYTYETNVMGTLHILECIRKTNTVRSFLNVTTDKVYKNNEWVWGYRENEPLDGFDPYSNSKSCSELVTHCYKNAFFNDNNVAISTARAGNVIGGGDFAQDRIIPDCVRAVKNGVPIIVRNPYSTRPYQHVLEPLFAYLMIAKKQYEDPSFQNWYNIGPDDADCITTGELVNLFCTVWGGEVSWKTYTVDAVDGPHEANLLKLDCSLLKSVFSWRPRWNIETAVERTIEWEKAYINGEDICEVMDKQIKDFMNHIEEEVDVKFRNAS